MATCPLCEEQFEESAPFAVHLADRHGLHDDEDAPSTTVAAVEADPRPPAAWYVDPVVPTQKRLWDGSAWTSDVGALFPDVPAASDAGGHVEQQRLPTRHGTVRYQIALAVAVLLAAGTIVVAVISTRPGAGGPNVNAGLLPRVPGDEDLASLVARPSDLPPGFTSFQRAGAVASAPPSGPCVSPLDLSGVTTWVAQYHYQVQRDGTEHGFVLSEATRAVNASAIEDQRQYRQTSGYRNCLEIDIVESLRQSFPRGSTNQILAATVTTGTDRLPVSSDEFVATTYYRLDGVNETATSKVVHLYHGRYQVYLEVAYCTCATFPDALVLTATTTALAARLQALPAG